MKGLRKVIAGLLSAAMMLSVGVCLQSNDVLAAEKKESDSYGYSWNWSDNVDNYVFERDDGGLTTVEHFKSLDANYNAKDYITVHEYAGTSKPDKEFSISMELSSWGGFFHGENYNFFVFGQSNTDQNDKKEVVEYYFDIIKEVDLNGDGQINFYEFKEMMTKNIQKKNPHFYAVS